jgi:hypothetical protein
MPMDRSMERIEDGSEVTKVRDQRDSERRWVIEGRGFSAF